MLINLLIIAGFETARNIITKFAFSVGNVKHLQHENSHLSLF